MIKKCQTCSTKELNHISNLIGYTRFTHRLANSCHGYCVVQIHMRDNLASPYSTDVSNRNQDKLAHLDYPVHSFVEQDIASISRLPTNSSAKMSLKQ